MPAPQRLNKSKDNIAAALGEKFDPEADYVLVTHSALGRKLRDGYTEVGRITWSNGEEFAIMVREGHGLEVKEDKASYVEKFFGKRKTGTEEGETPDAD